MWTFKNLTAERDTGPDGEERVTLPGKIWHEADYKGGLFELVCDETGGWIRVSGAELANEFAWVWQ